MPNDLKPNVPTTPELKPPKKEFLRVLVADDHAVVREGLVSVISRQPNMQLVAEARNGREAVERYLAERPDVALFDLRMPLFDGIEAMQAVLKSDPAARIVILTNYETEEDIYRALQNGAAGYFLKESPVEDLIDCIRIVAGGGSWIPPRIGAKLAKRVAVRELTPREQEVLNAVYIGKSNKEIGVALNISESTVKVHITHILEKLGVTGRTEAINAAIKRGLVKMADRSA